MRPSDPPPQPPLPPPTHHRLGAAYSAAAFLLTMQDPHRLLDARWLDDPSPRLARTHPPSSPPLFFICCVWYTCFKTNCTHLRPLLETLTSPTPAQAHPPTHPPSLLLLTPPSPPPTHHRLGAAYSAAASLLTMHDPRRLLDARWLDDHFLPFLSVVLCASVLVGMSLLFGWHVWLVLSGQVGGGEGGGGGGG